MNAIQAYQQSAATGDKTIRLIILLYDQLLRDLHRAIDAIDKGDIDRRRNEINHGLGVLDHLQATLNMQEGGEVAERLERFYNLLRGNVVRASMQNSVELLQRELQNVTSVREAWAEVERTQGTGASATSSASTESLKKEVRSERTKWTI
jgi:flagellar protein FliS